MLEEEVKVEDDVVREGVTAKSGLQQESVYRKRTNRTWQ